MAKYRKRPVKVEAIPWTGTNLEEIKDFVGDALHYEVPPASNGVFCPPVVSIQTYRGNMEVSQMDYIIRGVNGEFCPCKPDIFKRTYDFVSGVTYQKKPVEIEAIPWTGDNVEELRAFVGDNFLYDAEHNTVKIRTLEGDMKASGMDYIIRGVDGEFYPCNPDTFAQIHVLVTAASLDILETLEEDCKSDR